MGEQPRSVVAHQFSKAADGLVEACRRLEERGLADEPIERLLLALEEVTQMVHRWQPPDDRIQTEAVDRTIAMAWPSQAEGAPPWIPREQQASPGNATPTATGLPPGTLGRPEGT